MRRRWVAVLAGLILCACSSKAAGLPAATPSSTVAPSPNPVPAGWVVRPDDPQGYSVATPDSWDFVARDSPTYSTDMDAVGQDSVDLQAYFKLALGADTQVRFIAGDPHNLTAGFAANIQVISSDLGPSATAPTLADLVDAKSRLLATQTTLVQPVKRTRDVLSGNPAERLDYTLTGAGSPVVRSFLTAVQRGGRTYEYELTMGALPDTAATTFTTIGNLFAIFAPARPSPRPAASATPASGVTSPAAPAPSP